MSAANPALEDRSAKPAILLVDDRYENLLALKGVLASPDLDIVLANGGNDALSKVLGRTFCCILLDIEMPGMNGLQVAEILRGDPVFQNVPIILMSAHRTDEVDVFRGYEFGAVDYLVKPFDPAMVRSKVRVFADLFRKQRLISELNRALITTNEDLRQFTKVAVHDLKEPARVMSTYCQILQKTLGNEISPSVESSLEVIIQSAARLRNMLDGLVALLNIRDASSKREWVDLGRLTSEVLSESSQQTQGAKVDIHVASLPFVHGNRAELKIVMVGLLANATRAQTSQQLRISISGQHIEDNVVISVCHSGDSLAPNADRAFELFHRAGTLEEEQGSGMATMATYRTIVEKHGGRIWLESRAEEGTSCHFSIPRLGNMPAGKAPTPEGTAGIA